MTGRWRVLVPGADWDDVLACLAEHGAEHGAGHGLDDIYFDHRYLSLYAHGGTRAEALVYTSSDDLFFFPFLRSPIDGTDWYDFETAYGYGGPLATTERPDFLADAWAAFGCAAAELRMIAGLVRFHPLLRTERFAARGPLDILPERRTVLIRLDRSAETVWHDYADDNRRKIRKAEKLGLRIETEAGLTALSRFSTLYRARMDELQAEASYLFAEEYFAGIAALGEGRHMVCRAMLDGETIGGALLLLGRQFVHYHLSASRSDRFSLGPNNALRHAAILAHLGGGRRIMHFGGGLSGDPADTLLAFKRKFSRETAEFAIGRCVLDRKPYDDLRAAWAHAHPDRLPRYGGYVLCYRF